ncbi:MAG: AI-2E family transporter [Clostridiales bacterium]|nr:AI-2E family transporter [Clostridiales bacterium]
MQTIKDLFNDKKLMKYSAFVAFTMVLVYVIYFIIKNLDVILGACANGIGSVLGAFTALFIGIVLAYILDPAVEFFDRKLIKKIFKDKADPEKNVKRQKKQRLISTAITYLAIIAAIIIVIYIFTSLLIGHLAHTSFNDMVDSITNYVVNIEHTFKSWTAHSPSNALTEKLTSLSDSILKWLSNNFNAQSALDKLASFGGAIVNFFLGLLVSFWLVLDKDYFIGGLKRLSTAILPDKEEDRLERNLHEIDDILSHFIRGICLDAVIIAVLSSIVLTICGLKYAVIIGIFAGLCNVIPYFGPVMGMIPAFFVGFLNGGLVSGIIPVIALFAVQQVDSNFIYPKVVGGSTGLHPVLVLLAVVVGGVYGGIVGMLIAVPIASILKLYAFKFVKHMEARKNARLAEGKETQAEDNDE